MNFWLQGLRYTPIRTPQEGSSKRQKQQITAGVACVTLVILVIAAVELVWYRHRNKRLEEDTRVQTVTSEKVVSPRTKDRWDAMAAMNIA